MPNVMAALLNISGARCSMPQFGWRPLVECRALTLPRRETRWNLLGSPKLTKRSQPLVGEVHHIVRTCGEDIAAWQAFFPIVDICLSCEDIARQSCAMVRRWRFFASFLLPCTHLSPHPKWHVDQFSCFCTAHSRESLYFTMGSPFPPQNCPFALGDHCLVHASLGPTESATQTTSRSVQRFLQGSRWWQTDRPCYSVCNNRPHLLT